MRKPPFVNPKCNKYMRKLHVKKCVFVHVMKNKNTMVSHGSKGVQIGQESENLDSK